MFLTNLKRVIKAGFFSFLRNGFVSLSSIMVMVVTLLFIGSIIFFSAGMNSALEELRSKVDVRVSFQDNAEESHVLSVQTSLENLPEVAQVVYTSREDVYLNFIERHRNDPTTLQALEELGENPLGATLNIKAHEPSQYEGVAEFLENMRERGDSQIYNINYFQNKEAIDALTRIIDSAERFGLFLTLALVAISIVITFNTIRLAIYISKEEISVMKLVGASTSYIKGPFVIVGIIYGIMAGLLALAVFYPVTLWVGPITERLMTLNIFNYYVSNFGQIFLILVGSGIFIGAVSSYLAVKKYLKS
jgi:cell division transport system permease protein